MVVDDPTYPGALGAFAQAGAVVVGTPMDSHGVRVDALAERLRHQPAALYLQSTLHSPTGRILAARRRQEIAELVAQSRVPLIEDLALADLAWSAAPPGCRWASYERPTPLALRFARIKATHDLGSSAVSQLLAERLLAAASWAEHAQRRRGELRFRYEVLTEALHRHLPRWSWAEPSGGLSPYG